MGKWAPSPKEEPTIIPEDPSSILNHREWVSRQKQIQIAKAQVSCSQSAGQVQPDMGFAAAAH